MAQDIYNAGEPVFDMETGEPYIDDDGAMVEVSPGSVVTTSDGRTLSGDNCANAAWLRANIWQGEALRDKAVGVPYPKALGQSDANLAVMLVTSEVRTRTPGVTGVLGVRVIAYSPSTRVLRWSCELQTAAGATIPATIVTVG